MRWKVFDDETNLKNNHEFIINEYYLDWYEIFWRSSN